MVASALALLRSRPADPAPAPGHRPPRLNAADCSVPHWTVCTGKEVPKEDVRKAFTVTRQKAVILRPEELEELAPAASRDIHILRFVPPAALGDQWYERPYYLGPDGADSDYFALAEALGRKHVIGIVRWVMRNEHHVGGLTANDGYLTISTLRRADQVLRFSGVEPARTIAPLPSELKLAERLVASISADFDPSQYQNQHRKRLRGLIEAKARGEKIEPIKPKKKTAKAASKRKRSAKPRTPRKRARRA